VFVVTVVTTFIFLHDMENVAPLSTFMVFSSPAPISRPLIFYFLFCFHDPFYTTDDHQLINYYTTIINTFSDTSTILSLVIRSHRSTKFFHTIRSWTAWFATQQTTFIRFETSFINTSSGTVRITIAVIYFTVLSCFLV